MAWSIDSCDVISQYISFLEMSVSKLTSKLTAIAPSSIALEIKCLPSKPLPPVYNNNFFFKSFHRAGIFS